MTGGIEYQNYKYTLTVSFTRRKIKIKTNSAVNFENLEAKSYEKLVKGQVQKDIWIRTYWWTSRIIIKIINNSRSFLD